MTRVPRGIRTLAKQLSVRAFHTGQKLGIDVLPRHFYSEIPDIAKLRRTTAWRQPYSLFGVHGVSLDDQLACVRRMFGPDVRRHLDHVDVYARACEENGEPGYGVVEAQVLYAFVRTHRPAVLMQVGSGVSTAVCLQAAGDAGYAPIIVAIDPYPTTYLQRAAAQGRIDLVARPVETLEPSAVARLKANDLLFIDSSHALGPAGEVSRLILEFLPRLSAGVTVHFHDVYLPFDYPGETLTTAVFFSHETALLYALLVNNSRLSIAASLSMLHHGRPGELSAIVPRYQPRPSTDGLAAGTGHFPSSIYLETA